ncbi:MAG: ABC transporter ATP-binding protein [Lysinibacillus sp.]
MNKIMEVTGLGKKYKDKMVFENLSLSIFQHQIVALVGSNGSGKSTLLKIIAGLAKPDEGDVNKLIHPLKIGYVPEVTPADLPFTPEEYLMHMGAIRGMDRQPLRERIDMLMTTFHLQHDAHLKMKHFSKGMKQKMMIIQALLEETDLLILDEPLSGLDPQAQMDVEQLLLALKERGLSIILTCHETKLLENVADRMLLLQHHQIVETTDLDTTGQKRNALIFEIPIQQTLNELLPFMEITQKGQVDAMAMRVEAIVKEEDTDDLIRHLLLKRASIKQLIPVNNTKEAFYRSFSKRGGELS